MTQTERGCLFYVFRLLAILIIVIFIPLSAAVMVAFNLERQVFNPEVYKSALDQQGFYDHAPELIGSELYRSIVSGQTTADALTNLSQSDMQTILANIMPADWIKAQTESALDQFFAMLDTDDPPQVTISLSAVKQRMAGPQGVDALSRLVASWPECTNEQLFQGQQALAASDDLSTLPACNPPAPLRAQLDPIIAQAAQTIADNIPAEVNLAESFNRGSIEDPRPTIRLVRQIIHFSPIAPLLLLMLVAALAVRKPKDLNTWWGIPMLLSGMIGVVIALAMSPLRVWLMELMAIQASQIPGSLREVVDRVLQTIAGRAGLLIGAESALVALVGFLLLVFGFSIWRDDGVPPRS